MALEYQTVDLTTPAELKRALDASYGESASTAYEDAVLAPTIDEVSGQFTAYIQQHTLRAEREETYWIRGVQRAVTLKGCAVDPDSISIEIDDAFIDEDDYMLHADRGWFQLHRSLSQSRVQMHKVVVTYTGGLSLDPEGVKTGYPDLHEAALMQMKYRINRTDNLGGALTVPQGMTASANGEYGFLRHTQRVLDSYRRWVL